LLEELHIPYITLLDLDIAREGGGWGRVKYALQQLIKIDVCKKELLEIEGGKFLSDEELEKMHTWSLTEKDAVKNLNSWATMLKQYNIFYSNPLDLDFLMLTHYTEFYKKAIPKGGGPRIPDKTKEAAEFDEKVKSAVQATLKSEKATGEIYTAAEKELMIWYNYHFLGRGKPTTHIEVLSSMSDKEIKDNLPPVFIEIFSSISSILNPLVIDEEG
jgi:hypothetical protein